MVVDQFPAWVVAERIPMLPDDGGFARLRREGTWHRQLRYLHAATDTAPGHSSLFTGHAPRESGILANELPNGRGGRDSILDDPNAHAVTPTEVTDAASSSIARLRVETVADALRARVPDAVIVSVSLKDRGAIFGGGRHPDATLWFDPRRGSFVTSTAFSPRFPAWAVGPGGTEAVTAARPPAWTLLDAPWVRDHAATPDAQPGEGDLDGWGTVFPHSFANSRRPHGALRASPFGDEAVLRVALAAARGPVGRATPCCSRCRSRRTTTSATSSAPTRGRPGTSSVASTPPSRASFTTSTASWVSGVGPWCSRAITA